MLGAQERELTELFAKQKYHNWASPKHAMHAEAHAEALYRRTQQHRHLAQTPFKRGLGKAGEARTRATTYAAAPSAASGGPPPGGVVVQGLLQLCLLKSSMVPGVVAWEKQWCVVSGCCMYLYSTPQQRSSHGVVVLSAESRIVMTARRLDGAHGTSSAFAFHLKNVESMVHEVRYRSVLLCTTTKKETQQWAVTLAQQQHEPFVPAPSVQQRQVALRSRAVRATIEGAVAPLADARAEGATAPPRQVEVSELGPALKLRESGHEYVNDLSWGTYTHAAAAVLTSRRDVEHPFDNDLEEGLTVWVVARHTLRRVAVDASGTGGVPVRVTLCSDRAYLVLNATTTPPDEMRTAESDQMRVELHYWTGARATSDAAGAAAIFAIHLQQALESEARLHREEESLESPLFRSYFGAGGRGITIHASSDVDANGYSLVSADRQDDLSYRRHERCCLWPRLPSAGKTVLYHVASRTAAPSRIDNSRTPISGRLLDEGGGAFVLEVTAPDGSTAAAAPGSGVPRPFLRQSSGGFGFGGGAATASIWATSEERGFAERLEMATRRPVVRQMVWGGAHLLERPAAAERMTAVLFSHDLHNRDHQGTSSLTVLSDGTYAAGELPLMRSARGGAARALSGSVTRLIFVRIRSGQDDERRNSSAIGPAPNLSRRGSALDSAPPTLSQLVSAGRDAQGRRADTRDDGSSDGTEVAEEEGADSSKGHDTQRQDWDDDDDSTPVAESDGDEAPDDAIDGEGGTRARPNGSKTSAMGTGGPGGAAAMSATDDALALALDLSIVECHSGRPSAALLEPTDVVVVHTEAQVFVWSGTHSLAYQRWAGARIGKALSVEGDVESFDLCRTMQGAEPATFTSLFVAWPLPSSIESQLAVLHADAAAFVDWPMAEPEVSDLVQASPTRVALDLEGIAIGRADLAIWEIQNADNERDPIQLLPKEAHGMFRSDRCYMVLHTYVHDLTGRKMHELLFWVGKHAERMFFMVWRFQLTGQMAAKVPLSSAYLVEQHMEPPRFFAMFNGIAAAASATSDATPAAACTDGAGAATTGSAGYGPPRATTSGLTVPLIFLEAADAQASAAAEQARGGLRGLHGLFCLGGSSTLDLHGQQVAQRAASLNSWSSFMLQLPAIQILWHGKGSNASKRAYAEAIAAAAQGDRRTLVADEASAAPEQWAPELWAALPDGRQNFRPPRLVTQLPAEPRLFYVSNVGGRWQIDEMHCFGRAALVSDRVLFLDAFNTVFIWHGRTSRIADQEVAPRFARLYLRAVEDGRPSQLRSAEYTPAVITEGSEPLDFTCHFFDWLAFEGRAHVDVYSERLDQAGRADMFGRVVQNVYLESGTAHKEGPCASLGVSQAWLAEVSNMAAMPKPSDTPQMALPSRGFTLVVTSLSVDVKKQKRCALFASMLVDANVEFTLIDLNLPQWRQARTDVARLLRARSRSELDILSLPLLLRDDEVLLVSDERPDIGWPRIEALDDERALRELIGLGVAVGPAAAKNSRSLMERLHKYKGGSKEDLPTLEEVRHPGCAESGEGTDGALATPRERAGSSSATNRVRGASVRAMAARFGAGAGASSAQSASAVQQPQVQGPSQVVREGYLEKEGGLMKNTWERRFFVLARSGYLYWFKEGRPKEVALGSVQVGGDACRLQTLGVKLSFELVTNKKSYVLRAQDGKELADWLKEIRNFLNSSTVVSGAGDDSTAGDGAAVHTDGSKTAASRQGRFRRPGSNKLLQAVTAQAETALDGGLVPSTTATTKGGRSQAIADRLSAFTSMSRGRGDSSSDLSVRQPSIHGAGSCAATSTTTSPQKSHTPAGLSTTAHGRQSAVSGVPALGTTLEAAHVMPLADQDSGRARVSTMTSNPVTLEPPSQRVPFGLLAKSTRRGTRLPRFFMVRDNMLLYYEATKEVRSLWERMATERGASTGGWCRQLSAGDSGGMTGVAGLAELGAGSQVSGEWLVGSASELWQLGQPLCEALDVSHPRGALPLVDASVQPMGDEAEGYSIKVSSHGHEVRMLCGSQLERGAWLQALRRARVLSAHRLYIAELAKEKAEAARDMARRERDDWQQQAERVREEASANEAAAQRARAQLDAFASQQQRDGATLASREMELSAALAATQTGDEAREKLNAQLRRSEERAAKLLAERDAAVSAHDEVRAKAAEMEQAVSDARDRASVNTALAADRAKQIAELETELARERERSAAALASAGTAASAIDQLHRPGGAPHGPTDRFADDGAMERQRQALALEQKALEERRAQLVKQQEQRDSKSSPSAAGARVQQDAAAQPTRSSEMDSGAREDPPARPGWRSSFAMPRLDLPAPRRSFSRSVSGRLSRAVSSDSDMWKGPPPPSAKPPGAPPAALETTHTSPPGRASSEGVQVDALRQQVEAEEEALRRKREEREERRLRRQLELAEAKEEVPPPPPPPEAALQTRGRQMSWLI